MNYGRLEKLADFLEGYNGPIKCEMGDWARGHYERCGFLWRKQRFVADTCCAIGLAAHQDAFDGQMLLSYGYGIHYPDYYRKGDRGERLWNMSTQEWFGLTGAEFVRLFTRKSGAKSFKEAALGIREAVRKDKEITKAVQGLMANATELYTTHELTTA